MIHCQFDKYIGQVPIASCLDREAVGISVVKPSELVGCRDCVGVSTYLVMGLLPVRSRMTLGSS